MRRGCWRNCPLGSERDAHTHTESEARKASSSGLTHRVGALETDFTQTNKLEKGSHKR